MKHGALERTAAFAAVCLATLFFALNGLGIAAAPRTRPAAQLVTAPGTSAATPSSAAASEPWQVDHERSHIVVVLDKAGFFMLRFLGHEHGILARGWTAHVEYDESEPEAGSIEVVVPVAALEIDSPEARRLAGIDEDGPSAEDLSGIRAKMLSDAQLAAERFPEVRFTSSAFESRGAGGLQVRGTLAVRGVELPVTVPLQLERRPDGLRARGELEVRHTDFGIEPVSVAGVVKVADPVTIRVDILVLYPELSSPPGARASRGGVGSD